MKVELKRKRGDPLILGVGKAQNLAREKSGNS